MKRIVFSARLTSTRFLGRFLEILGERAWTVWWDLTWGKDVLEPGERCADVTHRRTGEGRTDHDGTSCGTTDERGRGDLRCRATSGAVVAILSHLALAGGRKLGDNQRGMCGIYVNNVVCILIQSRDESNPPHVAPDVRPESGTPTL